MTSPSRSSKMPFFKDSQQQLQARYPENRTTLRTFSTQSWPRNSFPETGQFDLPETRPGRFAAGNSTFENRGAGTFCSGTIGGNDSFAAWLLISKPHQYTMKIGWETHTFNFVCVCMLPLLSQGMGSGRTLDHRYFKNTILDCI